MRFFRIFFLHLRHVFELRGVAFVYFLMSIINPIILTLFWRGATNGGRSMVGGWSFGEIASYYFFVAMFDQLLMAHIDRQIADRDIRQGQLVMYLMKPFSYILKKFYEEFTFRLLRASFGLAALVIFCIFFGFTLLSFHIVLAQLGLVFFVVSLGFFVSFFFRMIVGISAFWLVDATSMYDLVDVVMIIFAGLLLPLSLLPSGLGVVASVLPFAYMLYFPVLAFVGKLHTWQLWQVLGMQVFWIGVFYGFYQMLWRLGVKKFTGVGQ